MVETSGGLCTVPEVCLYRYRAIVTEVYDGDTITVDIDLGFHTWIRGEKIRLYGINAPEVRGEEREDGLKSRDWLRERILGKEVTLRTHKDKKGKYGRYLADVTCDGLSITVAMVSVGLAEFKNY